MASYIKVHIKIKKTYRQRTSTNFSLVPPGLANARPAGRSELAKAPPPGLTERANAPQLPEGGGRAQLELTDALGLIF